MTNSLTRSLATAALLASGLASCQSLGSYVSFLNFGSVDRKEALIEEVKDTRERQVDTQEHFATAFQAFHEVVRSDTAELETLYESLQEGVDLCEEDLEALQDHIAELQSDATRLFDEWTRELDEFSSSQMRDKSMAMLADTKERHERLILVLSEAEAAIEPVLGGFRDYVLFFNHNLNPRAIATLRDTYDPFVQDLGTLRIRVQAAIDETDDFLRRVEGRTPPHVEAARAAEQAAKQAKE